MKFYSFANVAIVINGRVLTGWDEGDDVIEISRLENIANYKVGAAGEMMVSLSTNKSGRFKFKLQQTSEDNAFLNALAILQEAGPPNFAPLVCLFQDTHRRDLAAGALGFFESRPAIIRGANAGAAEWNIIVDDLSMLLGTGG
jgi:hypothetical protein